MTDAADNALLGDAKNALASGEFAHARGTLAAQRHAVLGDYGAALKFARLAKKLPAEAAGLLPLKVALLSSTTTQFFEPLLVGMGAAYGLALDVRTGDFGSFKRAILDTHSWLYAEPFDAVVLASHYRDANFPAFSENPEAAADACARAFESLWQTLKARTQAAVFQYGFDTPALAASDLSASRAGGLIDLLRRANILLRERARANGVAVLDIEETRAVVGAEKWEDARLWHHARQHPAPDALPALALALARALRARFVAPKKVCAVDLDNTLWGGVVGEDGAAGLVLGAPDARGEAFVDFQRYLLGLKERGILLAACSKNDIADAESPFRERPEMALKREDFAGFKANWLPKSENLRALARELNLGLDSFVFVDENPAEIAEVRANCPEVVCVQLPNDPAEYACALARGEHFDALDVSADDLNRARAYQENAAREDARAKAPNLEAFLASLRMRVRVSPVSQANLARAAQLAGKTNQFNLTTRRETAEQISALAAEPRAFARCYALADDFGDYGVVALALARPSGDTLTVETFLLSCRAMGRTLERFILNGILAHARVAGFARVVGEYIPTAKNAAAAAFYADNGFAPLPDVGDGVRRWEVSVAKWEPRASAVALAPLK